MSEVTEREREFTDKLEKLIEDYRDVPKPRRWAQLTFFAIGLLDASSLEGRRRAVTEAEFLELCGRKFREIRETVGVPSLVDERRLPWGSRDEAAGNHSPRGST